MDYPTITILFVVLGIFAGLLSLDWLVWSGNWALDFKRLTDSASAQTVQNDFEEAA